MKIAINFVIKVPKKIEIGSVIRWEGKFARVKDSSAGLILSYFILKY